METDPGRPGDQTSRPPLDAAPDVAPDVAPVPDDRGPVRAPSTEALTRLETELASLEAELAVLESGDGSDG